MQSQIHQKSPVLVELEVEVPWERVQQDLDNNYKEIAKSAKVKGFRPGKAPASVIKKMYGSKVRQQVADSLAQQSMIEAVEKHELMVIAPPNLEVPTIEQGKPFSFKAELEVRPEINEVKTEGLEIWKPAIEVKDEQVGEAIERLRHQHAEIREIDPPRAAKAGDLVTFDFKVRIDGEIQDKLSGSDRQAELDGKQLLPELEAGLIGTQVGEEKNIELDFPEDQPQAELKGKNAIFETTIKAMHEKLLPEADDEFAKDCGDYATLLELRLKIREDLEANEERRRDAELKEQVIDRLLELNEVPVPPSMVEQQQRQLLMNQMQMAQMMGNFEGFDEDAIKGLESRAERRVRAGLLLGALAGIESITVNQEDIDAKIEEMAEATGRPASEIRAELLKAERSESLRSELLETKLLDLLLSKATLHEEEPPKAKEAKKTKSAKATKAKGKKAKSAKKE